MTKIKENHYNRNTQVQLTPFIVSACKAQSVKIKGCPRPDAGSLNHFVKYAVYKTLKEFGLDVSKVDDKYRL